MTTETEQIGAAGIASAVNTLKQVLKRTPLTFHRGLSERFQCSVWLKREDLQVVRSYKLRGAYNMMASLSPEQLQRGVVCASAGNHVQGFAYSCQSMNVRGYVAVPQSIFIGTFAAVISNYCRLPEIKIIPGTSDGLFGDTPFRHKALTPP